MPGQTDMVLKKMLTSPQRVDNHGFHWLFFHHFLLNKLHCLSQKLFPARIFNSSRFEA